MSHSRIICIPYDIKIDLVESDQISLSNLGGVFV